MHKVAIGIVLLGLLLFGAPFARAQQSTERYIPMGWSPGLSHRYNYIGPIRALDPENRTLTVVGPAGARVVGVTERTRVWLDRTMLELTNLSGTFEDCQLGRTVEVKYEDPERREVADWIKVRITKADVAPEPKDE